MHPKWHIEKLNSSMEQALEDFLHRWQNNLSFELKSSGTTGKPKIFKFSKEQLIQSARSSIKAFNLHASSKVLLCLPLSSVGGLMQLARAMVGNFNLYIVNPSSRPLEQFNESFDFVSMVPTQLHQSLRMDAFKLMQIDKILIGGGPMNDALLRECWKEKINVWHSFGMSETLSHVALRKVSPIESKYFDSLPGISFSVENSCLVINYPALQIHQLKTKDIVELVDSHSFKWLGRADNAINSGGFKIIPELLEEKLQQHLKIPFFITGVVDQKWGQTIGLLIESSNEPDMSFIDQLDFLPHETPKKYFWLKQFKRTINNKIKRNATTKMVKDADWRSI